MNKTLLMFLSLLLPVFVCAQTKMIKPRITTLDEIYSRGVGYKGFYDFGLLLGGDSYHAKSDKFKLGISFSTTQGFQVLPHLFIGAGAGWNYFEKPGIDESFRWDSEEYVPPEEKFHFIPVFGNLRWFFRKSGDDGFYLSCDLGHSFFTGARFRDEHRHLFPYEYSGGLYFSPSFGASFPLDRNSTAFLSAGYRFQRYEMKGKNASIQSFTMSMGLSLSL